MGIVATFFLGAKNNRSSTNPKSVLKLIYFPIYQNPKWALRIPVLKGKARVDYHNLRCKQLRFTKY